MTGIDGCRYTLAELATAGITPYRPPAFAIGDELDGSRVAAIHFILDGGARFLNDAWEYTLADGRTIVVCMAASIAMAGVPPPLTMTPEQWNAAVATVHVADVDDDGNETGKVTIQCEFYAEAVALRDRLTKAESDVARLREAIADALGPADGYGVSATRVLRAALSATEAK